MTRFCFGKLLNSAWSSATIATNGINGFRACGIIPYNPEIILDYAFSVSDRAQELITNSVERMDVENSIENSFLLLINWVQALKK